MTAEFRVVTWNCRRAIESSGLWDYLLELNPDIALLHEVGEIPTKVRAEFDCSQQSAIGHWGGPEKFSTAILVRGRFGDRIRLKGLYLNPTCC